MSESLLYRRPARPLNSALAWLAGISTFCAIVLVGQILMTLANFKFHYLGALLGTAAMWSYAMGVLWISRKAYRRVKNGKSAKTDDSPMKAVVDSAAAWRHPMKRRFNTAWKDFRSREDNPSLAGQAREEVADRIKKWMENKIMARALILDSEVSEMLDFALQKMPVADVQILNKVTYQEELAATARASKTPSDFFLNLLAELHDVAIIRLGGGDQWREFVKKTEAERDRLEKIRNEESAAFWRGLMRGWGWQVAIIAALLGTLTDPDYSYYMLLRFACCAAFGFWAFRAHKENRPGWRNAFALTAAAYNPFLPLKLEEEWWQAVNLITVGLAIASAKVFRGEKVPMTGPRRLAEERSKAIDEALTDGRLDREKYEVFIEKLMGAKNGP